MISHVWGRRLAVVFAAAAGISGLAALGAMAPSEAGTHSGDCVDEGDGDGWGVNLETNEGCLIPGNNPEALCRDDGDGDKRGFNPALNEGCDLPGLSNDVANEDMSDEVEDSNDDSASRGGIHVPLFDAEGNENCIQTNSYNTCDLEPGKRPRFVFIEGDDIAQIEDPNDSSLIRDGVTVPLLDEDGIEYCLPHLTRNLNECDLTLKTLAPEPIPPLIHPESGDDSDDDESTEVEWVLQDDRWADPDETFPGVRVSDDVGIRDGVTVPLLDEDGNEYCLPHLTKNLNECDLAIKAQSIKQLRPLPSFSTDPGSRWQTRQDIYESWRAKSDRSRVSLEPHQISKSLIGQSIEAAAAEASDHGLSVRVRKLDGIEQAVTFDYRTDRINVEVTNGVVVAFLGVG